MGLFDPIPPSASGVITVVARCGRWYRMIRVSTDILDDTHAHPTIIREIVDWLNQVSGGEADPEMWTLDTPVEWIEDKLRMEWTCRADLIPKSDAPIGSLDFRP